MITQVIPVLETIFSSRELPVLLVHESLLSHKVIEVARNICRMIAKVVIAIRTVRHWFKRFKGNFRLDGLARSGRSLKVNKYSKKTFEQEPKSARLSWQA